MCPKVRFTWSTQLCYLPVAEESKDELVAGDGSSHCESECFRTAAFRVHFVVPADPKVFCFVCVCVCVCVCCR